MNEFFRCHLSKFQVVINDHKAFDIVNYHFFDLFVCGNAVFFWVFLSHFKYISRADVIVDKNFFAFEIRIFGKSYTSINNMIISTFIIFRCFLSNFLHPFYKPIMVSIWIIIYYSLFSIDFSNSFPLHFIFIPIRSLAIFLNGFELIRISSFYHQFVRSMLIK